MNVTIKKEAKKDDGLLSTLALELNQQYDGVVLTGKDSEGDIWHLVKIKNNGELRIFPSIPKNIILKLNNDFEIGR